MRIPFPIQISYRAPFLILVWVIILFCTPSYADKYKASQKIHELTQHMIVVIKNSKMDIRKRTDVCLECSHTFKERHIYQRTIDIENHLNTFLRMYGSSVEDDSFFTIKNVTYEDVTRRLESIDQKLERVLALHQIKPDHESLKKVNGIHTDFYSPLDRLEKFLQNMGSPSVQPYLVYKRAVLINQLVKSFCEDEICTSEKKKTPLNLITPKLPRDVFIEMHKFVFALHKFTSARKMFIDGGVTAPRPTSGMIMITPRVVNRFAGVILADLIALRNSQGQESNITLPKINSDVTPSHVWHQINNARQFIESLGNE